jgi:hypothetical protein
VIEFSRGGDFSPQPGEPGYQSLSSTTLKTCPTWAVLPAPRVALAHPSSLWLWGRSRTITEEIFILLLFFVLFFLQKMDQNKDGVVTLEEFLDCCMRDEDISQSMAVFDSAF